MLYLLCSSGTVSQPGRPYLHHHRRLPLSCKCGRNLRSRHLEREKSIPSTGSSFLFVEFEVLWFLRGCLETFLSFLRVFVTSPLFPSDLDGFY